MDMGRNKDHSVYYLTTIFSTMKTQKEIGIPTSPKDLRIRHFRSMAFAPSEGFNRIQEGLLFLASFTGLRYNQLLDFKPDDIKDIQRIALRTLSKMDLVSKLPEEVVLAGTSYYLVHPDKVGIGWHIDFKACNIEKDPVRLACLFYVQKGYNYSDVDENGNITYPIDSRYKVFEEHFPLEIFLRAANFFLKRSLNLVRKSLVIETISMRTRISLAARVINPLSGKQLLKLSWVRSILPGTKRSNSTTERSRIDATTSSIKK